MKNTTPHCPGPWKVEGSAIKYVDHGNWLTIATAQNYRFTNEGNAANARLIAAAPELLAALQSITSVANRKEVDPFAMFAAIEKARAAIAKATGEEVV